jgi:hypothetical protein
MRRMFTKPAFGLLVLFLSACGGGGSQPVNTPLNLTGKWQFTAKSMLVSLTVVGDGSLSQIGTHLSGQFSLSGTPCATTAGLEGTLMGTTLNFLLQEGSQAVSFRGTVTADGRSASGTYSAPSGECTQGDFGSWTATKVS